MSEKSDLENSQADLYQKRLFSFLLDKKVPPITSEEERPPYDDGGFIRRFFFTWVFRVLKIGYKRTVESSDLFFLPEELQIGYLHAKFQRNFEYRAQKNSGNVSTWVLMQALIDTFKYRYIYATCALFLCDVGSSCMPLLSRKLIAFVQLRELGVETSVAKGIGYSLGSAFGAFIIFLLANQYLYHSILVASQVRGVLTKTLLLKAFKADPKSKHDYPVSKLTTFVAADLGKVEFGIRFGSLCLTFPLTLIVCIAILAKYIGAPSAVGIGVIIFFTLALVLLGTLMVKIRKKSLVFTDKRLKYIKEVVNNLRIIKFYSWETPYLEHITEARKSESKKLYQLQLIRNMLMAFAIAISIFASMASFLVLYSTDNNGKNAANVFSAVTLFGLLGFFITNIPLAYSASADAIISFSRIAGFLNSSENSISDNVLIEPNSFPDDEDKDQTVIDVENATFYWQTFEDIEPETDKKKEKKKKNKTPETKVIDSYFLKDLNFKVQRGEFLIVTGVVGSGKSSLLHALAGFMSRKSGSVQINGSILMCSTNWVQNETLRNNILFGSEYNEKRYQQATFCCCLNDDFAMLPAGDRTEVGERGITLSGGQKARVNLARAVYNDCDIVMLDDVLSAVDSRVGKHIMETCILGSLKTKTRILATHQLSYINAADRVVFLNGDGTVDIGTVPELKERNEEFANLLSFNYKDHTTDSKGAKTQQSDEKEDEIEELPNIVAKDYDESGKLIQDERKAVNHIGWDVYKHYVKLGSKPFPPVLFICFILMIAAFSTFSQLFTNTWLSFWTEGRFDKPDRFYIGLYIMFAFCSLIFMLVEFSCYIHLTNLGSKFLHIMSVKNLLNAPMSYLDVTPIGRVLNRFTKDTDSLDNEIIEQIRLLSHSLSMVVGVLVLCVCYLPWFAIALPVIFVVFLFIGSYYQASSREIKRIEAVKRSLVFNNYNESLTGMDVIQAYHNEQYFINKNDKSVDNMNEANYLVNAVQRWLAMHSNLIAFTFVLIVTMLCVNRVFDISAASTGLLVAYVSILPNILTLVVQSYTQLENEMNSVERMCEFAFDLPQERPYNIPETKPPSSWPKGEITVKNVYMAYRPELPNTLKNVSFKVNGNERIGICGRTGAGKSSMISVLFRLTELSAGSIEIDGIDISTLGLNDLRTKLSIIPQESVLFRGTIRSNLDPFNAKSDDELWKVLVKAGILTEDQVEELKQGKGSHKFALDAVVEDDGTNFSLGEKQLVAFARALVKDSKILLLDEATSSVDYETDSKIQTIISSEFSDRTILCIAHRLQTILSYDKVLVMDDGEVKEFEDPLTLFQKEDSIFHSLCDKAKITIEDFKKN